MRTAGMMEKRSGWGGGEGTQDGTMAIVSGKKLRPRNNEVKGEDPKHRRVSRGRDLHMFPR